MIVVLDTNVLISATIQEQGLSAQIRRLWQAKQLQIATSEEAIAEYRMALSYPRVVKRHNLDERTLDGTVKRLREKAIVVAGKVDIGAASEDADDNKFLSVAVEAGANAIVSGDPHLLKLKSFRGIPIMKPRDFIEMFLAEKAA